MKQKSNGDYNYMHLNWFLQITNVSSLTKAPLFPLEDGQMVLTQPTQMGGPTFVNEKVVHKLEKKIM